MADRFLPLGFEKPEKVVASLRRAGNNDDSCSRGSDAIRADVSPESGTRCGLPFLVSVNRHHPSVRALEGREHGGMMRGGRGRPSGRQA
jgi:hypothetical protein